MSVLRWTRGLVCALLLADVGVVAQGTGRAALQRETSSIHVAFDARQPGFSALSIDSLQRGEFRPSPIVDPEGSPPQYTMSESSGWVRYALTSDPKHPVWELRCDGDTLRMRSIYRSGAAPRDLILRFNPDITHATLLGHVTAAGDVALPALLHLPGMGSLRVYVPGSASAALHYAAQRKGTAFVVIAFPAATAEHPSIGYLLQSTAIYPTVPGVSDDARFDGFRRDYLDIFQLHAVTHVLANNAASDSCAITAYEDADIARYTPELVKGLTALDLVRDTLDHYLAGFIGCGIKGYHAFDAGTDGDTSLNTDTDAYPSLLIAAYDYVDGSGDLAWLRKNYAGLRGWTEIVTAPNTDGSPLIEFPASGNTGSWTEKITIRSANWWDTIGFGHQDAYSNALAYRALRGMAALAERIGEQADAAKYRQRADRIHALYASTFIDPISGVVAGWKSADGALHNYYFPFANGIAVRYGLLDDAQGHRAMNAILAKMDDVGYRNFSLGLPGNLVSIPHADYVDHDPDWGGGKLPDGSDGFQIYENGGATACFSYFTLGALYHLGEKPLGDRILMPMLESFGRQGFSGRGSNGKTNDWKDWNGNAHGYEGFLLDNYYTFLAVLDRAGKIAKMP
jgi:Bacterial alpha-L-rhamnosidase 6 hairpin glycosidase domain